MQKCKMKVNCIFSIYIMYGDNRGNELKPWKKTEAHFR